MEPLKKYLQESGISQHELSLKLGVSESIVSYYLNGKRRPGRDMALRISQLTGIPVLELLYPRGVSSAASAEEWSDQRNGRDTPIHFWSARYPVSHKKN